MSGTLAFALRGDSLNARYAPGGATPQNNGGLVVQVPASGTGIIGTGYLDFYKGTPGYYGLGFKGPGNIPTSNKISMLARVAFKASPAFQQLIFAGDISQLGSAQFQFNSNALQAYLSSYTNLTYANDNESFTPTPDRFYDLFLTADMSGTTTHVTIYADGVLLGFATVGASPRPWPNPRTVNSFSLLIGMAGPYTQSMYVNEICIWDGIQDPTSVLLNSGTGSLNGQSRNSYVSAAAVDGSISNSDVRLGVASGSLVVPAARDVREGTIFDANTVGTLALTRESVTVEITEDATVTVITGEI